MSPSLLGAAWAASLWTAAWQGAIFVALVWTICLVFRKLPPRVRAWLWWLAAAKLVLGLFWVGIALPVLPAPGVSPLASLNHRLDLLAPKVVSAITTSTPVVDPNQKAGPAATPLADFFPTMLLI